jgi:predicted DNA-binding protein with PD1-like motif
MSGGCCSPISLRDTVADPMKVSPGEPNRELVVVFESGDHLRLALKDLCLDHGVAAVLLGGTGVAREATLRRGGASSERVPGPLELLQLVGSAELLGRRLAIDVRAVACRPGQSPAEVFGGVVDDVVFERAVLRITTLTGAIEPVTVQPEAASQGGASSWASVAAASAEMRASQLTADDRPPRAGDLVDHPTFGRVKVVKMDDEHLRVRREGGRTISLGLSRIQLTLTGEKSDGKHVYKLEVVKGR